MSKLIWLLFVPWQAWAHMGPPYGMQPFLDDGELVAAGGASGFVFVEDGAAVWACEDSFVPVPNAWDLRGETVVAATSLGVWESEDRGCNWGERPELAGHAWGSLLRRSGEVWIASLGGDQPSQLRYSSDGGATFGEPLFTGPGERFLDLAEHQGVLWLLAEGQDDRVPSLRRSEDGGVTWTAPLSWPGWSAPRLFDTSEDGTRLLLGATSSEGRSWLLEADGQLAALPTPVADFYAPLSAATEVGGETFVVTAIERIWAGREGAFEVIDEAATSCLRRIEGQLWACGFPPEAPLYRRSADGRNWQAVLDFAELVPRQCPADSDYAGACPEAWQRAQDWLTPRPDPSPTPGPELPEPPGGCAGGGAAWLLLALGWRRGARAENSR